MKQKHELTWAFGVQWVLANTVGWIIGMLLTIYIGNLVEIFTNGVLTVVVWATVATIAGITIGINQWFVMRLFVLPMESQWLRWWVIATMVGWIPSIAIVVGMGVGEQLNFTISGAIIGITMGIAQWFVLRKQVLRAEWWPIATTIGWLAGLALMDVIDQVVGFLLAGLVSGIITGWFLLWLLRHPPATAEDGATDQ